MIDIAEIVNKRRLIDGPEDKLMCISPLKHKWAFEVLDVMEANTWLPAEIDMSRDAKQIKTLDPGKRRMYDKALAFLSNLDGIQFNNLVNNIGKYITSPEVSMCISRQAYEEANHVRSYATMIEAVSFNPLDVYMTYQRDSVLAEKNQMILAQSEALGTHYSPRAFALAVVSNILLEGIFFFSGFLAFYTLARGGEMLGSADMIRLIQRDEVTHMHLFLYMLDTLRAENPEVFDRQFAEDAMKLVKAAVELEVAWGQHIISGGVLGLTDSIIDSYIKHLANDRCERMGLMMPYPGVKNPVPWVEDFSNPNGNETNFFEGKISTYSVGTLEW